MDLRNRVGLYNSYFLGMAGIGFTLPFLPLCLGEQGMSDRPVGIVSTLSALAGLAQFPIGVWSDHVGRRKPFLIVLLGVLALATLLLPFAGGPFLLGILVLFFVENGLCRAAVENLAGAEATHLAPATWSGAFSRISARGKNRMPRQGMSPGWSQVTFDSRTSPSISVSRTLFLLIL